MDNTPAEYTNIAAQLDEEELLNIGNECKEAFDEDSESRSEWNEMCASWIKLFFMKDKPLNPPWAGSSTESIPMLLEACNQSHARAYSEMFGSRNLVTAYPSGSTIIPNVRDRIKRISAHMSYQLLVQQQSYKTDKDRMLLSLPLFGCMFSKCYYDNLRQCIKVDTIRPTDLVYSYTVGPTSIEDIPRKTERIWLPMYKAAHLVKLGYFTEMPKSCDAGETNTALDDEADAAMGLQPTVRNKDYALIGEQHTFLDLDGSGLEIPYIVTFDITTGKVLRIAIRYEVDAQGIPTSVNAQWYDYKKPIEYYTDYQFIPNPNGTLGLGYGILLQPLNTAVNKLLRQTIDAGTLQTSGNMSGFFDRRIGVKGQILKFAMGEFRRTESSMDDINKGIFQFKFPGPSAVVAEVLRLLTLRGDRLAMVTETITGQAERVMQPTTVLALIEQAQIIFQSTHARTISNWSRELQKLYNLNFKYGQEYQQFMYSTDASNPQEQTISNMDYAPDMQVYAAADPKMASKREKLALSDAEFQTGLQCPFTQASPLHLYQLYRRRFEAIGCQNIDEIMPPMPTDPLTGMPVPPPMAGAPMGPGQPPISPGQSPMGGGSQPMDTSPSNGQQSSGTGTQKPVQQQGNIM